MRASFDEARRLAPSILFIDELDALGDRARCDTGHRDYWSAVVTGFLELMDGPNDRREGVVLIAATNQPEVLDKAILRAGRFDRIIELPLPDLAALEGILQFHGGQDLAGIDLGPAARLAQGLTGADCARVVRGTRRTARQAGRMVTEADLLAELDAPEKRGPKLLMRIAIHEAGHAVAAVVLRPGKLIGATILERGPSGGSVSSSVTDQPESVRDGIGDLICQVLAGRAAEQALLGGTVSGGSGGGPGCDLAQATAWALAEETAFGAGGCGLVWSGMPDASTIAPLLAGRPALEARVSARLDAAYADTLKLMRRHEVAVRVVAAELISQRSLSGEEIEDLVKRHPPLPETAP
ncbi:MAG: AAA family ATPase [Acetobacteraceae bacterium]